MSSSHHDENTLNLGVFRLHYLIGEGGMGEVWLGTHHTLGTSVAIKILREARGHEQRIRDTFLREAESVARLLHPSIIRVFDYGEIPEELEHASQGKLRAKAPYITMELATRGSLAELRGVMNWRQLKWLLVEVLNALAHAHARDLIHRDLKPDNILLSETPERHTCVKLTDFGIVHLVNPEQALATQNMDSLYAGTPAYMSPEQIRGKWRDFGPWTDLYAVGCLAYELSSGKLPFEGNNLFDIAHQQLSSKLPPLVPRAPVPAGFDAWIERLLQKNPEDRYQRAMDAAWALENLPELSIQDESPEPITLIQTPFEAQHSSIITLESEPELTSHETLNTDLLSQLDLPDSLLQHPTIPNLHQPYERPPLPASWVTSEPRSAPIILSGAGLGLHGLREIPLVARHDERDRIWKTMLEAYRTSSPRSILIEGASGLGKSRLAHWMSARAHELGAAHILRATHPPKAPARQGIVRMLARYLNVSNLSREKIFKRLKHKLKTPGAREADVELDALTITELLAPATEQDKPLIPDGPQSQLNTPRERYLVIAKLLIHLSLTRPIFMVLDDAHHSLETLEILKLIHSEPQTSTLPLFILTTIVDSDGAMRPGSRRLLGELEQLPRLQKLVLGHLDAQGQRELIDAILPLEDPLPQEIIKLSHGHPIFAVQLISEWIGRDILTTGEQGYTLKPDTQAFLPTTLDQLWSKRVDNLLHNVQKNTSRFSKNDIRVALEIAACIGNEVAFREWGMASSTYGQVVPSVLLGELTAQGFAEIDGERWVFCHEQLRAHLQKAAQQAQRFEQMNMSCAHMINKLYTLDDEGAPERLVDYLLKSDSPQLAIEPLLFLAEQALMLNEYDLCEQHLHTLHDLIPTDQPSQARQDYTVMRLRWLVARHGAPRANTLFSLLKHDRHITLTPELELMRIQLDAIKAIIPTNHLTQCDRIGEQLAEQGNTMGVARALLLRGTLELERASSRAARRCARTVLELLDTLGASRHQEQFRAQAFLTIAKSYLHEQRHDKATLAAKRAESHFNQSGDRHGIAASWLTLGQIADAQDNLAAAEQFYQDARNQMQEIDHAEAAIPMIHHALLHIEAKRYQEAMPLCEQAIHMLAPREQHIPLALAHLIQAAVHASRHDLDAWRARHDRAEQLLHTQDVASVDLARAAEVSAVLLSQYDPQSAIHAIMLASTHLIRCERHSDVLSQLTPSSLVDK